jgi:hypothetical protein
MRLNNAVISNGRSVNPNAAPAYSRNFRAPMLNFSFGGQQGWTPNLTEWVSNQAYVRRHLIPILLEAPRFFELMPNSAQWYSALKALVELHCLKIDGLKGTLEVETEEHAVGGAGEVQEEFVNVKRERSTPTFTFQEKYGLPIQTFLTSWITYGMMDPESKFANTMTFTRRKASDNSLTPAQTPPDQLADFYTMSMLFIEPDPTHQFVQRSWTVTNMFPKTAGEVVGTRDLNTGMEMLTLDIEFTALSQHNLGNNLFAQSVLDSINLVNANPYLRHSFIDGLQAKVEKYHTGYDHNVRTITNLNVETQTDPKWTTNNSSGDFPSLVERKSGVISSDKS